MSIEPGIHFDIPAAAYHADPAVTPSLSSSIAKVILEATPRHAWLKHPRLNPKFEPASDDKFSLGSVVHELILGRGGGIEIIDSPDYRTKDAKQRRTDAFMAGLTPILAHQYTEARKIADAAREALHEISGCKSFFDPNAKTEVVIVWEDIGGPLCRAMLDCANAVEVWDVKTTSTGLSDSAISRSIVSFGYDLSAAFYLRGMRAINGGTQPVFRWIFVETEPPYEVRVIEADATTLAMGDRKAATAIAKWQSCMLSGEWPGYPRRIETVAYPSWAEAQWLEREILDPDYVHAVLSNTVTRAAE